MDHSSIYPPVDDDPRRPPRDIVIVPSDQQIRIAALQAALEMRTSLDGPPVDRVLRLARRFETYIATGKTDTAPQRQ